MKPVLPALLFPGSEPEPASVGVTFSPYIFPSSPEYVAHSTVASLDPHHAKMSWFGHRKMRQNLLDGGVGMWIPIALKTLVLLLCPVIQA